MHTPVEKTLGSTPHSRNDPPLTPPHTWPQRHPSSTGTSSDRSRMFLLISLAVEILLDLVLNRCWQSSTATLLITDKGRELGTLDVPLGAMDSEKGRISFGTWLTISQLCPSVCLSTINALSCIHGASWFSVYSISNLYYPKLLISS